MHFYMVSSRKFGSYQKSSAKLMRTQQEHFQQKKHKAILQKIYVPHNNQQTYLRYSQSYQKVQTENLLIDINDSLDSGKPDKIIEGLRTLNNQMTEDNKQYFQSIAHQFIPCVLAFIQTRNNTQLLLESIIYLTKVASFGKLSEENVQIFKSVGVDIILKKIKHGTTKDQCELFVLVANLAIDSVAMRDFLIQKGTIEVILWGLQQNLKSRHMFKTPISYKQNSYFALIALVLGDPLPPIHKVERAVNKIVADIDNIHPSSALGSSLSIGEVVWVLYHHTDYREEKQCIRLLKQLFALTGVFSFAMSKKFKTSFKEIFMQVYDYYSEKPDNEITPIIHGCYCQGTFVIQGYQSWLFSYYTPKMYIQLFKEAVKHRMNRIGKGLVRPLNQAFDLIKKEIKQEQMVEEQMLPALKFIAWVLCSLIKQEDLGFYKNQFRPLEHQQKRILIQEIFPIIKSKYEILKELRHSNQRQLLGQLPSVIVHNYHKNSDATTRSKLNIGL